MAHITRDDGVTFIIPSYRDILSAKKSALLKREISLLATSYGEYITLQKKSPTQYEVAFSPEPGYLLGETVWSYFNRPRDLIYCETIPNTTEAILVIVKSGSVYLDGSFPIDSIPEELVVFQTQQNQFEIYIYGDVPISVSQEWDKFSFEPSAVKSFTVLDTRLFPVLPVVKQFQLQLVDIALKAHGIGRTSFKSILSVLVAILLVWMAWEYWSRPAEIVPTKAAQNPYQAYQTILTSPDPAAEIQQLTDTIIIFQTIPGWQITQLTYDKNNVRAKMISQGMRTNILFDWAKTHQANVEVKNDGFFLTKKIQIPDRPQPNAIHELKLVLSNLIDKISYVLPGNPIRLSTSVNKGKYSETDISIGFTDITPTTLNLIGQQFKTLPMVLSKVSLNVNNNALSGTIDLKALGN